MNTTFFLHLTERLTDVGVPEYGTKNYPEPMVDHKEARERCLKVYKSAVSN